MHAYRSHTCGALRRVDAGQTVRLAGWVHRKRDHGQLLFVDLRDHYGITQCVIDVSSPLFAAVEALRLESVVSLTGRVTERSPDTINPNLPTGEVELVIDALENAGGMSDDRITGGAAQIIGRQAFEDLVCHAVGGAEGELECHGIGHAGAVEVGGDSTRLLRQPPDLLPGLVHQGHGNPQAA